MISKLQLFFCALFLLTGIRAAVPPTAGSADNPVWYYIQTKDAVTGDPLVCTVEDDNFLYGRAQVQTTDIEAASAQLWRFESQDNGLFTVINKKTGYCLGYKYDSNLRITKACVVQTASRYKIESHGDFFGIRATIEGAANVLYLGISADAASDHLMVELTEEQAKAGDGMLSFGIFNDTPFKGTVSGSEYWYNILSAKDGVNNMAVKDNSKSNGSFPFAVTALDENDQTQQWKLIRDGDTGKVDIVNRATGFHILTNSFAEGVYNATMNGYVMKHPGFTFSYLGLKQYAISGVENDDIERYLAMQDTGAEAVRLDPYAMPSSAFAWTLREAGYSTGVDAATVKPLIKIANGTVSVENFKDYTVTNALGIAMPKDTRLLPGVYFVIAGGTTTKVTIK